MARADSERDAIFPDRIACTPDADQQTVELQADCAVGSVFERFVPQTVVTPAGFEPAFTVRHALSPLDPLVT